MGFSSLCVNKEITYEFLDDVIRELAAITPGRYIHMGGDEAHSTTQADYLHFMDRMQPIVRAHGKRLMGWEEIAQAPLAPGTLAQHWGTATGSEEGTEHAREAAAQGPGPDPRVQFAKSGLAACALVARPFGSSHSSCRPRTVRSRK